MHLISRDTLKKKVSGYIKAYKPNPATIRLLDWLMNIVDNLPVIEERKKGYWIKTGDYITAAYGRIEIYRCSVCHKDIEEDSEYGVGNYCSYCGAEMIGDKNDIKP